MTGNALKKYNQLKLRLTALQTTMFYEVAL